MKYLKAFNESKENNSTDLNTIKDILTDLKDDDSQLGWIIEVNNKSRQWRYSNYIEIIIKRNVSGHNGGILGFEFIWKEIKETIFRLMNYYYSENDKPEINNTKILLSNTEKIKIKELYNNSPFRLFGHFRNGFGASDRLVEFGIGFTSEEDFENADDRLPPLSDYTRFEKIKILIKR
jgi:hypothetical protein